MKVKSKVFPKRGGRGLKRLCLLLTALLLVWGCCACFGPVHDNRPYEPDTPAPAAHDGLFVSAHGSMRFHGDEKTVTLRFDSFLAELTGLPEGEQEAAYVFLSGDLPPHGSVPVRYDTAHELQLSVGEKRAVIELGVAAEDGKSAQAGVGTVTPERIPLLFSGESGTFTVLFEKEAEQK